VAESGAGALVVHVYAGVGVVRGTDAAAEWQELNLKSRSMEALLTAAHDPTPPNTPPTGPWSTPPHIPLQRHAGDQQGVQRHQPRV